MLRTVSARYDFVGDVHGHARPLHQLLSDLGYRDRGGVYQHPDRRLVFVGDLIDRGPAQREVIAIARSMVEAGTALAVMGNHELNALAFATPDPDAPGEYLRPRSPKNIRQHRAFLEAYPTPADDAARHDVLGWFRTLPLWLELDEGLRVVHACWHAPSIEFLRPLLAPGARLTPELLEHGSRSGTPHYEALENVLKGYEAVLPPGVTFRDKDGNLRDRTRIAWWRRGATTYRDLALVPSEYGAAMPDQAIADPALPAYGAHEPPVVFGHYWLSGTPGPQAPNVRCLDYSVARGGPLVCWRWPEDVYVAIAPE